MKILVRKPCDAEIKFMSTQKTWESDICEFDYTYDSDETVLIDYGRAEVCCDGEWIEFGKGDLVFFPKYLDCKWRVLEPIRKFERWG